jgi:transcriptional regulator with XRE-family HTH domain
MVKKEAIHQKIKGLREMRNYTQEYMAEVLSISQRAYSSLENGQTQLTVDRLVDVAEALQVNIGEIIGYDNQYVYNNNFNNNATQNKGNLVFNQDNFEEQRQLYERLLAQKEEEIAFLKRLIEKQIR